MHMIPKYEACQDDDTDPNSWYVRIVDGKWSLGLTLNESEANIIVFALNAVADGLELWGLTDEVSEQRTYDGPTEGVATRT